MRTTLLVMMLASIGCGGSGGASVPSVAELKASGTFHGQSVSLDCKAGDTTIQFTHNYEASNRTLDFLCETADRLTLHFGLPQAAAGMYKLNVDFLLQDDMGNVRDSDQADNGLFYTVTVDKWDADKKQVSGDFTAQWIKFHNTQNGSFVADDGMLTGTFGGPVDTK